MTRSYRFVHISDIHFGQDGGTHGPHRDARNELLRDCATQNEALGPADGILVTGDIAFSGKHEQFARAGEWLDKLAEAAGCSPNTSVRVIPGNHDIDRSPIDYFCETRTSGFAGLRSINLTVNWGGWQKPQRRQIPFCQSCKSTVGLQLAMRLILIPPADPHGGKNTHSTRITGWLSLD